MTKYSGEIKSSDLGNAIMTYLLDLDEVAYVRFASVYKEFKELFQESTPYDFVILTQFPINVARFLNSTSEQKRNAKAEEDKTIS